MNPTKIEWCDYTWNPVTGCLHWKNPSICQVGKNCYGLKIAKRFPKNFPNGFEPTFHQDRLIEPYILKKPSKIFTVSMGDLFGNWVPDDWINKVIKVTEDNSHHIFQFLTKNPARYKEFNFPRNCWLGITVNYQGDIYRIMELTKYNEKNILFVSFEPLYGEIQMFFPDREHTIDWVIVGAQTNPYEIPEKAWIKKLIRQARSIGAPVFLKDNLHWYKKIQEYPLREE